LSKRRAIAARPPSWTCGGFGMAPARAERRISSCRLTKIVRTAHDSLVSGRNHGRFVVR
jgi:hypothetical protein